MAEEAVVKSQEGEQQESKQEAPVLTEMEQKASAEGWHPKEEWQGNPDEWKDAKTFLRDGELFKKIEEVKRENKTLKRTVSAIKGHYEKVQEVEYARALASLKAQKKEALVEGDADKVIELDDKIADVRDQLTAAQNAPVVAPEPEQHPEFVNWVSKNRWYENNAELHTFADTTGFAYKKAHPEKTPAEVFSYVTDRVAKAYPEFFRNQRKDAPNTVEGGQSPTKSKVRGTEITLTADEVKVMNRLVRTGVLTEEQYKKDIQKLDSQGKR